MNEQDAKKFVVKTILTGNKKRIQEVISRFRMAYRQKKSTLPEGKPFDAFEEAQRLFK
jgi:hypothetical protein